MISRDEIIEMLDKKRVPETLDDLEKRLWGRVRKIGERECWVWFGYRMLNRDGVETYGRIGVCGELWLVHRLVYTLEIGEIPDGLEVLHRCDNPPCCNPSHYFLGTAEDNNRDCVSKGRGHNNGKLTRSEVLEIRNFPKIRNVNAVIAEKYGISRSMAKQIRLSKAWRGVAC